MSIRSNKRLSLEQRQGIFNAQRALFIYVSFHLMTGLFLLFYSTNPGWLALLNVVVFPILLLSLALWSINRPYPAFVSSMAIFLPISILQVLFQNLVGLIVIVIVFYYLNQGRILSYRLQLDHLNLKDILDSELED